MLTNLVLGPSRRRSAGQWVFLAVGPFVAALGVLFPAQANTVACVAIGFVLALLGLSGLLYRDQLAILSDGTWRRTRGFGPAAKQTEGQAKDLSARVVSTPRANAIATTTADAIVVQVAGEPDLLVWPDSQLYATLDLRPGTSRLEIADAINRRLRGNSLGSPRPQPESATVRQRA